MSVLPACRQRALLLSVLILLATSIRLLHLGAQNLWLDEAYTAWLVGHDFADIVRLTAADNHPPLYYLLLKVLEPADATEWSLRIPSMVFSVLWIPATYRLALRLVGPRTALLSALLVAVSPIAVYYGQEARMYSMLVLLILLASDCFLAVMETGSRRAWAAYTILLSLAFYIHIAAAFLPPALAVACRTHPAWKRRWRPWIMSHVVAGILCLPWVAVASRMLARVAAKHIAHPTLSPLALPYAFFAFSLGYSEGPSVADWHRSLDLARLVPHLPILVPAAILFSVCFGFGVLELARHRQWTAGVLTTTIFVFVIFPYAVALALSAKYNVRYSLAAQPFYLIAVAAGIRTISHRLGRPAAALVLVLLLGLSVHSLTNWFADPYYGKPRVAEAADYVRMHLRQDDALVVAGTGQVLRYYWPLAPDPLGPSIASLERLHTGDGDSYSRVWLLLSREWEADPDGNLQRELRDWGRVVRHLYWPGVRVILYERRECRA